jgi:adenylate cyclase
VGIGIHAGEAVTGNVGTSLRKQYSITGNVVIVDSRLEQQNKQFQSQLLISEEVWKAIGGVKDAVHLGIVQVKGEEKPVSL